MIENNVDYIRHDRNIALKSLNGPEGSVSAATVDSLHLLDFELRQLKNNTEKLGYRNLNFLGCMILSLENLHSTVNKKHDIQSVLTYAQSFASSMKEFVKQLVEWAAYYFTSMKISLVRKIMDIIPRQIREIRVWASSNGASVRQRSEKQET